MSKNVLIVDDDPVTIRLIRSYLESDLVKIQEAHDGEEGLQFLKQSKADLVILDIACGNCVEGSILKSYFEGEDDYFHQSRYTDAVYVIGIDNDEERSEEHTSELQSQR